MQAYLVAPVGDRVGEGVLWADSEQSVYWVDMVRFLIHRCHLNSRTVETWHFAEPVVALSLTSRVGTLLVALGSKLILWRPEDDDRVDQGFRLPGWPSVRMNDGRSDVAGNFWVGSMPNNIGLTGEVTEPVGPNGALYRIAPDGSSVVFRRNIGISNTVCWSPDSRYFYFADTKDNAIWRYDYEVASATISNGAEFFVGFDRGLPDGSCVDSAGYLWNCRHGGSCVVRVAPDGTVDRVIEIPANDVTNCTLGGPLLRTLLITTGSLNRRSGDQFAGSLFGLDVAVPGTGEHRYGGK
jgi:sugar lactone lactonase YvrE